MAKIKQKTSNRAKTAHAPARTKVGPRSAAGGSRKATVKPATKAKASIVAKKSMKSAAPRKGAAKAAPKGAARKAAVKKPPAKKIAAVKPVKKAAKPLNHTKPLKHAKAAPVRKATPAKTITVKKPVIAKAAKSNTSTRNAEQHRKFVTNSKPETIAVPKSKARAMRRPSDYNVTMQDGRFARHCVPRVIRDQRSVDSRSVD